MLIRLDILVTLAWYVGAAVFAVLLAIGGLLWAHFGEAVYLDRIFSTIANCI